MELFCVVVVTEESWFNFFFNIDSPPDPDSLPIAQRKGKRIFTSQPISQFVSYGHSDPSVFSKFNEAELKFGLGRCQSDHFVFSHTFA